MAHFAVIVIGRISWKFNVSSIQKNTYWRKIYGDLPVNLPVDGELQILADKVEETAVKGDLEN